MCIGPMARHVEDLALLFPVISAPDGMGTPIAPSDRMTCECSAPTRSAAAAGATLPSTMPAICRGDERRPRAGSAQRAEPERTPAFRSFESDARKTNVRSASSGVGERSSPRRSVAPASAIVSSRSRISLSFPTRTTSSG